MKHGLSHTQRFLQKMTLTPQMRQSIQLLGMSVKDLNDYIDSIVANNPFLKKIIDDKRSEKYRRDTTLSRAETDYIPETRHEENPRITLISQLKISGLDDKALEIAEYLIYEMDENGYIKADPAEVAHDLSVSLEDVDEALEAIQAMEPAGIGARNVRECMQIQLKRAGKAGSLEYALVSDFINEVARSDIKGIAKALKLDENKVRAAINNVKKLNPRPASTILSRETKVVIPELLAKVERNKIRLEFNRSSLPTLKLYNPYEKELDIIKDPEAREFMKENMNAANILMDNLKRREDTICKVANYILEFQKNSLLKETGHIKSLTLKEVARALDFHPSTVSRAISNKYIAVNDTVVLLNSLLSHGITKENGEVASKTSVKKRIGELVKAEERSSPLTDDEIKEALKEEGIILKRRTIAKYRESLKILPSYLRKKS